MTVNKEIIFFLNNHFHQKNNNNIWEKHSLENYNFKSEFEEVDIYIDCPYFNIIPDELFNELSVEQKKKLLISNDNNYDFFKQPIPHLEAQLFWCEKKTIIDSIKDKIPNCNFNQIIKPLLINNNVSELKYYLSESFIYILSFIDGKLTLANRFFINNDDDILYFILNVIKETKLINLNFKFSSFGLRNEKITKRLQSIFPSNECTTHQQSDFSTVFK